LRLLAVAVLGCGLTPRDFWHLSPAELRALHNHQQEGQRGLSDPQLKHLQEWMKHGTRPTDRAD